MNLKTISVDWDSKEEILKLHNLLKVRLSQVSPRALTKKQFQKQIFDCCFNILESDTSSNYDCNSFDMSNNYYVYSHLDITSEIVLKSDNNIRPNGIKAFSASLGMTHIPFYIGKGKGNRCNVLNINETHRKIRQKLNNLDKEIKVHMIKENINELEAIMLEDKLIDIFGLKIYGGLLTNLDEGVEPLNRRSIYISDYNRILGKRNYLKDTGAHSPHLHHNHSEQQE